MSKAVGDIAAAVAESGERRSSAPRRVVHFAATARLAPLATGSAALAGAAW
jgi:hypothetical protein